MVSKAWRVRFAPQSQALPPTPDNPAKRASANSPTGRQKLKSKSACVECKLRRVKCDETYPACRRCQRRGDVCTPAPRRTLWKLEMPLLIRQVCCRDGTMPSILLQYYFERVCHIMVLDPDTNNPLALPLLDYFKESSALLHAVQSIAAAHKSGFRGNITAECLDERKKTLLSVQQELFQARSQPVSTFLAIFLLGISSPWIEGTLGLEHLVGARAVVDLILDNPEVNLSDPAIQLIIGTYVWWEMAASFNLSHHTQKPLDTDVIDKAVLANRMDYHPLAGYSLEIFHILGKVNRYCRRIVDWGARDYIFEEHLEAQMLGWMPAHNDGLLFLLGESYRKHGLIQLYRICGPNQNQPQEENELLIQKYAGEAMECLLQIPKTSPYLNFQPIPLLSAASEIPPDDLKRREEVKRRFQAIYSLNNLPVMLDAINLLEEIWELRALGITSSWLVILLERGQVFPLA